MAFNKFSTEALDSSRTFEKLNEEGYNMNFYNDDFTTMEFVVDVLVSIFNKSHKAAEELMLQVHEEGSSVVGIYTYDVAVSRTNLAIQAARKNGFPLRVEIE